VLDAWVGPETVGDCLGDVEDTSRALFLLRSVAQRGAHPALFRSGAAGFAALLAEQLDVKSGVEVTSVECDGSSGALVRFRDDEVEGTAGADAVVLAAPAFVACELARGALVAAERDFYRDVSYLPAISAEILADDPVVPRYVRARTSLREPNALASLAVEPGGTRGRIPDGHAVVRLVARSDWSAQHLDAPDDAVEKELLAEAVRLFPVLAQRARSVGISRWPHALPRFEVGRFRALARVRAAMDDRAAAGRRLYFAGDYLGGPSVDGAVASGLRAADALLGDLG
jgi:oxygen-dependent protoporphyrinogen oxidase